MAQNELPTCPTQGFKHNCIGEMVTPEGDKFALEFKDGKPNEQGKVTMTGSDGRKFVVQFKGEKDGNLIGQGTLIWPDGQKYVGEFKGDKIDGQGIFTWPNGNEYVGQFRDNKATGQGTMTFPNGNKYVGEFKDDKANGQGILTFSDGQKYVGEFKDDKRSGQGTGTFPNGNKYVVRFEENKANGQGTLTWPDGRKYVGEFKGDNLNGQGTMTFPNGNKFVGRFEENKANGQGTLTWADGSKHVGVFRDDQRDGDGIEYRGDGRILRAGLWQNNTFLRADPLQPSAIIETPSASPPVQSKEPHTATAPVPTNKKSEPSISSTGTGFFVSSRGHLLTNAHVVEGCKSLGARRATGEVFSIDLVAIDTQNDLALLKSAVSGITSSFRRGPAPLGTTITVYGFPLAGTLAVSGNLTTGSISALAGLANDPSKYQVSAPVQPGNSGGAVLDESGLVVGVVQSKLDAVRSLKITGDIPQNINFAIKSSVAQNFLEAQGVKYIEKPQTGARKASAIAGDAMHFSVLIACFQ